MPIYSYKCPKGHKFEDMNRMSERHRSECICGEWGEQVIDAVRLDPNMDTPGARLTQRRKMEERGRGRDMTAANRTVEDEGILRDAHAKRAARGENPISVSSK